MVFDKKNTATAEFDNFVQIWVDHLSGPLAHF